MTRPPIRLCIFIIWLASMAWLVRFQAFPEAFTRSIPGYTGLLSSDLLLSDAWMKILLNGRPAGYIHSTLDTDDKNALRHFQIGNQMLLAINIMGERRDIQMTSLVELDLTRKLQAFNISMKTGMFDPVNIRGIRQRESRFLLTMGIGSNSTRTTIDIPDDVVLYSPASTLLARNMEPGKELTMKTLDPFTRLPSSVTLKAIRHEPIQLGDVQHTALLLHTLHQGLTLESWIGENGEILRQTLPGGILIEKATPEEATDAYLKADATKDIMPDLLQVLGKRP